MGEDRVPVEDHMAVGLGLVQDEVEKDDDQLMLHILVRHLLAVSLPLHPAQPPGRGGAERA